MIAGFALVALLLFLTWLTNSPVHVWETYVNYVFYFFVLTLISFKLAPLIYGYSFAFDGNNNELEIQRRVFRLLKFGKAIHTTFANITKIEFYDRNATKEKNSGILVLTIDGKGRYLVTNDRTKAKLIQQMISGVNPNLCATTYDFTVGQEPKKDHPFALTVFGGATAFLGLLMSSLWILKHLRFKSYDQEVIVGALFLVVIGAVMFAIGIARLRKTNAKEDARK